MDPKNDPKTIWVFTPSRTDPKDLEFILVQREAILKDAVERVKESALTDHKHHLLFVGPRGCGKTHLVTLIVSRLSADNALDERLRIAWLNEDETSTTLLEFLLRIHAALVKRYPHEFREEDVASAYDLKPDAAQEFVSRQLLSLLGARTLLVVTENLDAIFDGLGDPGQKDLRAFIQENPKMSIVATAQRLADALSLRISPFFGFFQTEHLKPLNVEEAMELLRNIARLQGKNEVVEFLATARGRSRVRALQHLSGGNHRIYIVLSQFVTRDSIDALVGPFMKMVDELTPYYQERIRWLPILQRKIVEYLCGIEGTVSVKEIAKRLFATPQTISNQLQTLREDGYVEANQRGRESLYEVSEPLMRICVEVKENQSHQPIRLLVNFLRVWYDDLQLNQHLGKIEAASASRAYLESAIQKNSVEGNLRKQLFLDELQSSLTQRVPLAMHDEWLRRCEDLPDVGVLAVTYWVGGNRGEAIQCLDEAIAEQSDPISTGNLLLLRSSFHFMLSNRANAIDDYAAVTELSDAPVEQVVLALYNRGTTYAQAGEPQRAIEDYTAVIELPGAPVEQVAMALNNRGTTYGQVVEPQRAIEDYTAVIELPGAPVEQVAMALNNRGTTYGQVVEPQRAIEDYTAVIELPGAPVEQVAMALYNRGITYGQVVEPQRAIEDYTAVIELPGAPVEQVAMALNNRGVTYRRATKPQRAIEDYTAVIELPGAPVEQVALALYNRGVACGQVGEPQRAIEDYTAVIGLSDAPVEQVAMALNNRGTTYGRATKPQRAIEDYTAVIGLPGAPVAQVAMALNNRGTTYGQAGEPQRAIEDYTAVIGLSGAPVEQVALALYNRGFACGQVVEPQRAIEDYTAVIELPGAPVEQVVLALYNRGTTYAQAGEPQRAIEDYTAVIELPGAPVEQVAMALNNRGTTYGQVVEPQRAIEDYTAVIELPGAPVEQVAMALNNRGVTYRRATKPQRAIEDYTAVIELPGAPVEQVALALYNRGVAFFKMSQLKESQSDFETVVRLVDAPSKSVVNAYFALCELFWGKGQWDEGFRTLEKGLEQDLKSLSPYRGSATDLVGVIFAGGLNPEVRKTKITDILTLYAEHSALPVLGEAVVQHIGNVFRAGAPWPATDNLEQWASAWEQSSETLAEFRLPVRLLRAGVDFVKTGGTDPGILLILSSTERTILRQALGLAEKDTH